MITEFDQQTCDPSKQPKTLTRSRHIDNVLYVAGRSPREKTEYEIMFITTSVEEDEATTHATSTFGYRVPQPAEYLKGANGVVKDVALMAGIDMEDCYYTAVCKWLLPRAQRARPSKKVMKWGMQIIEDEIARVKPKIIVCLGKPVFDIVGDQKINFKDAHGCWFWNEQYQAHMYVMHAPYTLVGNPEHYETFRIDFKEIARRRDILRDGGKITGADVNYQVINNEDDLREWLDRIEELAQIVPGRPIPPPKPDAFDSQLPPLVEANGVVWLSPPEDRWPGLRDEEGNPILSVDCEWHGKTHVDGQLRTIQFAWSETEAVVIEFRDEENEWSFELEAIGPNRGGDAFLPMSEYERPKYAAVGKPIASTLARMGARFIGHHFAADAPWMQHWLGIETYERCVLDTEFAQQACDESSELGLERGIAMKYTNLGRYDFDLVESKRHNRDPVKVGYGYIPSKILYPYACLRMESKVQLSDGSWEPIGKLVRRRYSGEVKSLEGGEVVNRRVTNWHRHEANQTEWYRIRTASSRYMRRGLLTGPVFTPDHEVITVRGKVRVDELILGEDRIMTDEKGLTNDQLSVVLGSLLGDGGLREQTAGGGVAFAFSQSGVRMPYARWKAQVLHTLEPSSGREIPANPARFMATPSLKFVTATRRCMKEICLRFPRKSCQEHRGRKLRLSAYLLQLLGPVGLAVWYQDDGVLHRGRSMRIIASKLDADEVRVGLSYFAEFGNVSYNAKQGAFMFGPEASDKLASHIAPYIHSSVAYKMPKGSVCGGGLGGLDVSPDLFAETVLELVPAPVDGKRKGRGDTKRYCLTVEGAGNFLTTAGFVSNCKDVFT